MLIFRPLAGANTLSWCHGLLTYISQRLGRKWYSVSSKIDILASSSPRRLLGGRRPWDPMPKAVEPVARRSFLGGHGGAGGERRLEGYLTSLADSSALRPIYFCTALPGRCLVSCTAAWITVGVCWLVASIRAQRRSHLPRFWNAHRASWYISLVFFPRRMMPVGALPWGRHPWAGSQGPETFGLRSLPRLETSTPDDGFDPLSFLDTQTYGTDMVHEISCTGWLYGQRRVVRGILVRPHYPTGSIRKGLAS